MADEIYKMSGEYGDNKIEIDNPEAEKYIGIGIAIAFVVAGVGWALSKIFEKKDKA